MDFGKEVQKFSVLQNICYLYLFFSNIMYKLLVILFVIKLYVRNSVLSSTGTFKKREDIVSYKKLSLSLHIVVE